MKGFCLYINFKCQITLVKEYSKLTGKHWKMDPPIIVMALTMKIKMIKESFLIIR